MICGITTGRSRNAAIDLSAEHVGHRGRRATIRHMHDLDAGGLLEQFEREMRQAADARRGHRQAVVLFLCQIDQILHGLDRRLRVDDQNLRGEHDARDRPEVAHRIVGQVGAHVRIERDRLMVVKNSV